MSEALSLLHVGQSAADGDAALEASFDVTRVETTAEALSALDRGSHDGVLCDQLLSGEERGLDALAAIRERDAAVPVVLSTAEPNGAVAARATRLDVTEYVPRSEAALADRVYDAITRATPTQPPAAEGCPTRLPSELADSFDAVAGSISDAVVTVDAESEIVYANDGAVELTGYDREDLVGAAVGQLVPDHRPNAHREELTRYLRTGDRNVDRDLLELPLVTADNRELTVAVSFGDFERDGRRYCTGVLRDISDRKERERERALEDANQRLDLVLESTNTGVYEWDIGSEEIRLDEATAALFGTTPEAFDGTVSQFYEYVHPEDREALEAAFERAIERDGVEAEFRAVVDGETRWLYTSGVVRQRTAQASRLVAVATDVTERKAQEQTLRANNDSLQELTQLATRDGLTESEALRQVLDIGTRRLGVSFGMVNRITDGRREVRSMAGDHPSLSPGMTTALDGTYCARAIEAGDLYAIPDTAAVDAGNGLAAAAEFACYVGGEITVNGERYGTLCFADDEPRDAFSGTERAFIELLTEWVGRELERRQRAAELERYENIIEAVDDGVYALDSEGYFEFVNQAMTDLTGYSEAELLGSYTGFIKNDGVVERATTIVQEMIFEDREDEETFELEIQHASGDPFPAEDHMTLLYDDDGRFNGTAGVIRDITEQKRRDKALSGLLETTRSLMQAHTPEAVAETVIRAIKSDLGFDFSLVRLYDEETETLRPIAASDTVPERPVYDADEGFPGEAFQAGEAVIVDDFGRVENYDSDDITGLIYVPIGDHGVVSIGGSDGETLTDSDVSVAEILASNAAAALDRVERERSLLRYQSVVENVRDMVYVLDDEGRFQLVTEPLAEWLGYEQSALLGRRPDAVFDSEAIEAFESEIRALWTGDADAVQIETTLGTATEEQRPAEVEVSLLDGDEFQGTVGVVRDLTELKQTRAELADERDRFSYLFDTLPDAVIETESVESESVVRSANPAFTEVFGVDADAAVDQPLSELFRLPDSGSTDELPRFDAEQTDGDPIQRELRLMTELGFRDFLFRGVPYSRDGDSVRGFGIYTDITEQRERERRLKLLNRVLRHNLRNDMTVVLGMADALETRIERDGLEPILDRLRRKAEEIASLSERAREMEQSVRRDQFGTDPVDVPAVITDILASYRSDQAEAVETTLPDEPVSAGDGRLYRVFGELLENCFEHAGSDPTVRLTVTTDRQTVSVTVADDGPGIPKQELDVVTGDEPITQLRHGTGLGLWLVVWVTETYGGSVEFDTGPDGGSVVTVELPRTDR